MFRSLDGKPVRCFGLDGEGFHRVGGEWVETSPMNEHQEMWIRSLSSALHSLPRWPLSDGIDLSMFTPDSHQLAVVMFYPLKEQHPPFETDAELSC